MQIIYYEQVLVPSLPLEEVLGQIHLITKKYVRIVFTLLMVYRWMVGWSINFNKFHGGGAMVVSLKLRIPLVLMKSNWPPSQSNLIGFNVFHRDFSQWNTLGINEIHL